MTKRIVSTLLIVLCACILLAPTALAQRDTRGDQGPLSLQLNYSPAGSGFVLISIAVQGGMKPYSIVWTYGSQSGAIQTLENVTYLVVPYEAGQTLLVNVTDANVPCRDIGGSLYIP